MHGLFDSKRDMYLIFSFFHQ